jgi:hypothetical protein
LLSGGVYFGRRITAVGLAVVVESGTWWERGDWRGCHPEGRRYEGEENYYAAMDFASFIDFGD